jgi:hypothetical protein
MTMATVEAVGAGVEVEGAGVEIVLDEGTFDVRIHDGMVTIESPTGAHRTFRVKTQGEEASFAPGKRVVSLLRGRDREDWSAWTSFGFVGDCGVRVWSKHAGSVLDTYGRMLSDPRGWAAKGCTFRVEARCRRCGRALTHPESIATGLGPVCAGRTP